MDPYTARLIQIESSGDPGAVTGRNYGLGQFGPQEMKRYGITNWRDPDQQINAIARERGEFASMLRGKLGRDPTPGELYLTHQQGVAGGPALMTADPNMPAWQAIRPYYKTDAIAKQAITGNIPRGSPLHGQPADAITAGDFKNYWVSKFEGGGQPDTATRLAMSMQANPIAQPVPQPANPFDSIPRPAPPAPTFGHSPEAIGAAEAQGLGGVGQPPPGQNLNGTPWNFPAMKPMQPDAGTLTPMPQPPSPFGPPPMAATPTPQAPVAPVAPPAPPPMTPPTQVADAGGDASKGGPSIAGSLGQIGKAFGGGDAPKLKMPDPIQIPVAPAPGLQQARMLALAMAMRPLMGNSQG